MKKTIPMISLLLATLLASSEFCFAQPNSGDGIQAHGEVTLERKAEVMRMSVDLLAKGKNMADAIAKLKARRTKVEQQLVTLGAIKDSWKFGEIKTDISQNNRRKQMERMLLQRVAQKRGKPGKGKAAAAPSIPVDLTMKLTAEWPITAADPSELLISTTKLQDAIRTADLGGAKDTEESSEEEAEMTEEMENMGMNYGNQEEQKPGEPAFIFVAKIANADRQQALKDAFISAKAEATRLAQAADLELGSIRSLSSTGGIEADDPQEYQSFYNSRYGALMRQQMNGQGHSDEAIGISPSVLKFKVGVYATFAVK